MCIPKLTAARTSAGEVPVEASTWNALQQLAAQAPPPPAQPTPTSVPRQYSLATRLVHPPTSVVDPYNAAAAAVYQTSTFEQPTSTTFGPFDYTRSGNPTRTQLEEQLADIEVRGCGNRHRASHHAHQGADKAFAFASGMAAIAAVCRLAKTGEHIVAGDDLYGGTSRLLASVVPNAGVDVSNVDTTDVEYAHCFSTLR